MSYIHKAQAINTQKPGTFNETQLFILEAVWDNWDWKDLAQGLKIRFSLLLTKDKARKLAKKTLAYLNRFGMTGKYDRGESPNKPETMRKIR